MAATSFWLPQITQQDFHAWWLVILRGIHSSRPFCFVLLSHSTKVATGFCLARCSCQGWAPCLTCHARSYSASWEQDSSSPGNTNTAPYALSLLSFLQHKQRYLGRHLTPTPSSNSIFLAREDAKMTEIKITALQDKGTLSKILPT